MGERPLAAVGAAGGAYGGPGDGLQNDIHSDDDSGSPASSSGSSHGHGGISPWPKHGSRTRSLGRLTARARERA